MRFLLDEALPLRAASALRDRGIDAVHIRELAGPATTDGAILDRARSEGRIVVTLDADFHTILAVGSHRSPSVIRIRREGLTASECVDLILRLISEHQEDLDAGVALTVRAHLVGIRRLPLTAKPEPETDDEA